MISHQNLFFEFTCDPEAGYFSIHSLLHPEILIDRARITATFLISHSPQRILTDGWEPVNLFVREEVPSRHGPMRVMEIHTKIDPQDIETIISFAMPEQYPLFLWKVQLNHRGSVPVILNEIGMLSTEGGSLQVSHGNHPSDLAFYSNGWQSWAYSACYGAGEKQRRSRMGGIQGPMVTNPGTPQSRDEGHFSSDFFGICGDRKNRKALLAGFLSQKEQFGSIEARLKPVPSLSIRAHGDNIYFEPGAHVSTDWAVLYAFHLDEIDPILEYLEAAARENDVHTFDDPPLGWCSWYQYYQKITEKDIRKNLDAMCQYRDTLPLKLLQIDDGFEEEVGDWEGFRPGFPDGLTSLAADIRARGFISGLWLAPFIVHPNARLICEHPDFILRSENNKKVNAGFVWNRFTTGLDLTHPGALEYACKVIDTAVHQWGFSYLKLDFLYAGALAGKHYDPTLTRAQILRKGMEALRTAAGSETYLLGCGAPLGSVLGLVEAMRIGADVAGFWQPEYFGIRTFFHSEPHMPSAFTSIQNIITRAFLHNTWWVNDPDCLMVRSNTKLTIAEVQSLATAIAMTGGAVLISDDLTSIDQGRLRIAKNLIPVPGKRGWVLDWFDHQTPRKIRLDFNGPAGEWHVLACFNWEDHPHKIRIEREDFQLLEGSYWVSSFWDGEIRLAKEEIPLVEATIPPHGVGLFAVRPFRSEAPSYVGSNLHFSQGIEINDWELSGTNLDITLDAKCKTDGYFILFFPRQLTSVIRDSTLLEYETVGDHLYRIRVNLDPAVKITCVSG